MNTTLDTAVSLPAAPAAGVAVAASAPAAAAPGGMPAAQAMTALFEDVLRGVAAAAAGLAPPADVAAEDGGNTGDGEGEPAADPAVLVPALTATAAALVLPAAPEAGACATAGSLPSPGLAASPGMAATAALAPVGGALPGSGLPARPAQAAGTADAAVPRPAAPAAGIPTPVVAADAAAAAQRTGESVTAARAHPEPGAPMTAIAPAHAAVHASVADGMLPLKASAPSQWRQPLQEALGDRLKLQLQRGSEQAVIRLDPPTLGRIEILVRHEGGNVQVHLSASNGEVLRQLGHIGDSLRQDLVNRQYGDVSVVVSDGSRDAEGRQRQRQGEQQQAPGRALAEADDAEHAGSFAFAADRN